MYQIRAFELREVETNNRQQLQQVGRVGTRCPHCGHMSWFDLDEPLTRQSILAGPSKGECGGCSGTVRFYAIGKLEPSKAGWLWAHPAPSEEHQQNERVGRVLGELSPALAQAYADASGSLQDGRWSAAASEARRTLEGLVKHRLENAGENAGGTLEKLIEKLAGATDLAAPLMDTAHTVRQGGNVGAHYDTDRTADEPLARQLLELVEAMVEYLELLPRRVSDLRAHLENESPGESGACD